jgi:hypothetical protein
MQKWYALYRSVLYFFGWDEREIARRERNEDAQGGAPGPLKGRSRSLYPNTQTLPNRLSRGHNGTERNDRHECGHPRQQTL